MLAIPAVGKTCPEFGGFVTRSSFIAFTGGSQISEQFFGILLRLVECLLGLGARNSIHWKTKGILQDLHSTRRPPVKRGIP